MATNKNLPPSAKKLDKARSDGDVAKSRELTGSLLLTTGFIYVFIAPQRFLALACLFKETLALEEDFHTNNMLVYLSKALGTVIDLVWPSLVLSFVVALIVESLQVGVRFSLIPLSFRFSRLGLFTGLKRVFGFRENDGESGLPTGLFVEFGKLTLYMVMLGGAMASCALVVLGALLAWDYREPEEVFIFGHFALVRVIPAALLVFFLLGVVDLLLIRSKRVKRLRMDAEEFRRELRESEGDPETRSMRKQTYQQLLFKGLVDGVRRAKVVIADPDSAMK